MEYINAQQAAECWGISDRRVRVLCAKGKIPGVVKDGKSYQIPANVDKPPDGRAKTEKFEVFRYLKWENHILGTIDRQNAVTFTDPDYNEIVSLYTQGKTFWSPERFTEILSERVVCRDRRDIEKILFRCGLSHFDALQIAAITRGIHPKDLLWIAHEKDEKFEEVMTDVFRSVFRQKIDMTGDSIDTPEGYNIKRYGVYKGQYGIYKQRISPLVTDVESEIAVYLLAQKLGVLCCPAYNAGKDAIFSAFLFDFSKEYIVHFRRLFEGPRSENEYRNLTGVRPQFKEDIARMILLDFVTRQDDRHLSNMAIKISEKKETFYPLYDNGRSLFYEDTEEMVMQAIKDPAAYSTSFGYSGSYWDYAQEIAQEFDLRQLVRLDIPEDAVAVILREAGFKHYRLEGAYEWIIKAIKMLKAL